MVIARAFYIGGLNARTIGLVAGSLLFGLGLMSAYVGFVELFKKIDDDAARKRIRKEGNILILIGLVLAGFGLTLSSLCR